MISFTAVAPDDFAWIFRDRERDRHGLFPNFFGARKVKSDSFFLVYGQRILGGG